MKKISGPFLMTIALSGCAVGPEYIPSHLSLPDTWPGQSAQAADPKMPHVLVQWWQQFNDPVLTQLIEEGLQANINLGYAAAQVSESRAKLQVDESSLYPTLGVQGNAQRAQGSSEMGSSQALLKPYNTFGLSAVFNYEIDLWGRLRHTNEAGRASLLAQESNREVVKQALVSDIATGYFNLLGLDAQVQVMQETIKTRQDFLSYQQKQFNAGTLDILTFRQAENELAAVQAQLPLLEQAQAVQTTALGVLLGKSPRDIVESKLARGASLIQLPVPPVLPHNLPSDLLQRRPDVQSAENQMIASHAMIGVARSGYFPKLSLSSLLGLQSNAVDHLLWDSAGTWQAGISTAMPVLNVGGTAGNVEAARARSAQALSRYQGTVQQAFKEVLDAMNATQAYHARAKAVARQVRSAQEVLRIAQLRYQAGYSSFLTVLDAQRQLLTAQLNQIQARQAQLTAAVTLCKALGGGWDPQK